MNINLNEKMRIWNQRKEASKYDSMYVYTVL